MNRRLYQWHGPHTNANELGVTAADVPFGDDMCPGCSEHDCWTCDLARANTQNWGGAA